METLSNLFFIATLVLFAASLYYLIRPKRFSRKQALLMLLGSFVCAGIGSSLEPPEVRQRRAKELVARQDEEQRRLRDEKIKAVREQDEAAVRERQRDAELRIQENTSLTSADALLSAYEANEIAADRKFKGNVIVTEGSLDDIGKDILGKPYLIIERQRNAFAAIQASFERKDEAALADLTKGETVRVRCTVKGRLLGHVQLDDCVLR